MSQAKVDQRKNAKTNRKKLMRREKAERALAWILVGIVAIAICVWIGFSIYQSINGSAASADSSSVSVNTEAVDDYLDGLSSDTSEE